MLVAIIYTYNTVVFLNPTREKGLSFTCDISLIFWDSLDHTLCQLAGEGCELISLEDLEAQQESEVLELVPWLSLLTGLYPARSTSEGCVAVSSVDEDVGGSPGSASS